MDIFPGGGSSPTLNIAGSTYKHEGMVVLLAFTTNGASYATPKKMGSTAGYQVPVGKTFRLLGIDYVGSAAPSTSIGVALGYADTDVGLNTGSAPTNPVYWWSAGISWFIFASAINAVGAAFNRAQASLPDSSGNAATAAAGKYLVMNDSSSGNHQVIIYGREV